MTLVSRLTGLGAPEWVGALPRSLDSDALPKLRDIICAHRLESLVLEQLGRRNMSGDSPEWLVALDGLLREPTRSSVARGMAQLQSDRQVRDALSDREVPCVLLKGAAIEDLYGAATRPRADLDILVPVQRMGEVRRTLETLGFAAAPRLPNALLSHALTMERWRGGMRQVVDVHWQVSSRPLVASALPAGDVFARAQPTRGGAGLRPSSVDALMMAVVHPFGHHFEQEVPRIWMCDVALSGRQLSATEWETMFQRADTHQLGTVVRVGLRRTHDWLQLEWPDAVMLRLDEGVRDASRRLVDATFREVLWADLLALRSSAAALQIARSLLLPPPDYMYWRYGMARDRGLGWLYLRRWFGALRAQLSSCSK